MIFLIFVCFTHFLRTDGRVYCRDSNATPWRNNGYSCPLRCENIVAAAQRLKTLDSESIVETAKITKRRPYTNIRDKNKLSNQENLIEELMNEIKITKREDNRRMFNFGKGYRRGMDSNRIERENIVTHRDVPEESNNTVGGESFVKHLPEELNDQIGGQSFDNHLSEEFNHKITRKNLVKHQNDLPESIVPHDEKDDSKNYLTNEKKEDIKKLLQEELLRANETCSSLFDGYDDTKFNRILAKCALRSNFEKDLTRKIAEILNRHAPKNRKFDYVMITPLVKKALSTVLQRYGRLDVPMVLDLFEKAFTGRPSSALPQIRLKSSFCLNMYVPGCYCKAGYVESSGKCVRPLDCITDPSLLMYSEKISITT